MIAIVSANDSGLVSGNGTNQTQSCGFYCLSCRDQSFCLECQTGFYNMNGTCSSCGSGCQKCINYSKCLTCEVGYYFTGSLCNSCPNGCYACSSYYSCDACNSNYYYESGSCNRESNSSPIPGIISIIILSTLVFSIFWIWYKAKKKTHIGQGDAIYQPPVYHQPQAAGLYGAQPKPVNLNPFADN